MKNFSFSRSRAKAEREFKFWPEEKKPQDHHHHPLPPSNDRAFLPRGSPLLAFGSRSEAKPVPTELSKPTSVGQKTKVTCPAAATYPGCWGESAFPSCKDMQHGRQSARLVTLPQTERGARVTENSHLGTFPEVCSTH